MAEWQPIETAPRDGTFLDLWVSDGGDGWRVPDAYWRDEPFGYGGPCDFDLAEGWAAENKGYDGCEHWAFDPADAERATHWMPLTSPQA